MPVMVAEHAFDPRIISGHPRFVRVEARTDAPGFKVAAHLGDEPRQDCPFCGPKGRGKACLEFVARDWDEAFARAAEVLRALDERDRREREATAMAASIGGIAP